jgi:parallel beta-helix repeat protein
MNTSEKIFLGFMIFVVLTASVYVMLPNQVRIDVEKTKTVFKVWENESWVLAGTEYTKIYDGTSLMRAKDRNVTYEIEGNITYVTRTATYKDNIIAYDYYVFDGSTDDVTTYPVEHTIRILNGEGKILQYEIQDLLYTGETKNDIRSPQLFGHNMQVTWDSGNYYSQIYKYKNKDEGKLTVKYRPDSADFEVNVRLFDPSKFIYDMDYYEYYADRYQTIDTEYVTFTMPKTATHYWNTTGEDTYELIIQNFSIKGESDYSLRFTWTGDRYVSEKFQIHYDFNKGQLSPEDITLIPLEDYNKECLESLTTSKNSKDKNSCKTSTKSKLEFNNLKIEIGEVVSTEYIQVNDLVCKHEINKTCIANLSKPVYEWSDFNKINLKKIEKSDFLAIDDVGVSACGVLSTASTRYYQTANIDDLFVSGSDCIVIENNNIEFDGNGYWIHSDSNTYAIYSNGYDGITIEDVDVTVYGGTAVGIMMEGGTDSLTIQNSDFRGTTGQESDYEIITISGVSSGHVIQNNYIHGDDSYILRGLTMFSDGGGNEESNNLIQGNTIYSAYSIQMELAGPNQTVINNEIHAEAYGIYIGQYVGDGITIFNNDIYDYLDSGPEQAILIETDSSSQINITSNEIQGGTLLDETYGIRVVGSSAVIQNNIINYSAGYGIYALVSDGMIKGNTVNRTSSTSGSGIYNAGGDNMTIEDNWVWSDTAFDLTSITNSRINNNYIYLDYNELGYTGIYLPSATGNNVTNNQIKGERVGFGIDLSGSTNNYLYNTSIGQLGGAIDDVGIYNSLSNGNVYNLTEIFGGIILLSRSDNNNFTNTFAYDCNTYCLLIDSADNNLFEGGVLEDSTGTLVTIQEASTYGDSEYDTFKNMEWSGATTYELSLLEDSNLHDLINITRADESDNIPDGTYERYWWLDAYITYSGSPLENANVSVYDDGMSLVHSELTGADGRIDQWAILEYENTNGAKSYEGDYTITISKIGYDTNQTTWNVTESQNIDLNVALELAEQIPPTYSLANHSTTAAEESCTFSILWNDNLALETNGYFIFSTNNTGSWVNDSNVAFTETPEWANVTKTLTSDVGSTIGYRWYAYDNNGNYNVTPIYTLTTTEIVLVANITDPTQADPETVSGGEEMQITFDFTADGSPVTEGLSINEILIGGEEATPVGGGGLTYTEGIGWQVNVTTPSGIYEYQDLFINVSYNEKSRTDTETNAVYFIADPGLDAELNLPYFQIGICGPDFENASAIPIGQNEGEGVFNVTNNGTGTGTVQAKYTGSLNTGWTLKISNTSNVNDAWVLTDSYQNLITLSPSEEEMIWMFANCSYVNANPGVGIDFDVTS